MAEENTWGDDVDNLWGEDEDENDSFGTSSFHMEEVVYDNVKKTVQTKQYKPLKRKAEKRPLKATPETVDVDVDIPIPDEITEDELNAEENGKDDKESDVLKLWKRSEKNTMPEVAQFQEVFDDVPDEDTVNKLRGAFRKDSLKAQDQQKSTLKTASVPTVTITAKPRTQMRKTSYGSPLSSSTTTNSSRSSFREKIDISNEQQPVALAENEQNSPWRFLPPVPTEKELTTDSPELLENDVYSPYLSFEHYLTTHYLLLRDDALSPLRNCVLRYKENPSQCRSDPEFLAGTNLAVYDHVHICGYTLSRGFVATKLKFTVCSSKRVKWKNSRRLLAGSLVLLSDNDFKTFRVGTVAARPLSGLEKYPYEVDVKFDDLLLPLDSRKEYVMIESLTGYWEAYKHVLTSLQRLHERRFPFKDYLVHCSKEKEVVRRVQANPMINVRSILQNNESVAVNILDRLPEEEEYMLDESQLKAYQSILTNKLTLVQGPPGTGKTFVALKAIQTLLDSADRMLYPIIIACQTNHAVDQLLMNLMDNGANVIRLGARTKEPRIREVMLSNLNRASKKANWKPFKEINNKRVALKKRMRNLCQPFKDTEFVELNYMRQRKIISETQYRSLVKNTDWLTTDMDTDEQSEAELLKIWLGESKMHVVNATELLDGVEQEHVIEEEMLEEIQKEVADELDYDEELQGEYIDLSKEFVLHLDISVTDRELENYLSLDNVWDIPEHIRGVVYNHWLQAAFADAEEELYELNAAYARLDRRDRSLVAEKKAHLLHSANVVGMTTTGLNKYRNILEALHPKICFVEEAANVLEGPVIPAVFPTLEQLVLIGDHKQLRPICSTFALSKAPYNLTISMFERLVENDFPLSVLSVQRRMHPSISRLLEDVYPALRNHKTVTHRSAVPGMGDYRVYFLNHEHVEDVAQDTSKCNNYEAEFLVSLAMYLVKNGTRPERITILTFYAAQRTLMEQLLHRNAKSDSDITSIKITTVDGYQGEENDVILLSLVRFNKEGKTGFLNSDHRVCVSLSRARCGLYIVGNAYTAADASNTMWHAISKLDNEDTPFIGDTIPLMPLGKEEPIHVKDAIDVQKLLLELDVNDTNE